MSLTTLALIALVPILVWRIYQRLKAQMARQRSILSRHYTGLFVFSVMLLVPATELLDRPFQLAALAAGAIAGIALATYGLRRTRFEQVGDDFFFTPHAPIGLAVALLFMARMAWRAYEFFALGSLAHHEFVSSPLTLVIFGVLAGYYMSYAFGLLSWRKRTAPVSP